MQMPVLILTAPAPLAWAHQQLLRSTPAVPTPLAEVPQLLSLQMLAAQPAQLLHLSPAVPFSLGEAPQQMQLPMPSFLPQTAELLRLAAAVPVPCIVPHQQMQTLTLFQAVRSTQHRPRRWSRDPPAAGSPPLQSLPVEWLGRLDLCLEK